MQIPDFARLGPPVLEDRDLLFLFEHFPLPGVDPVAAVQRVHERPSTLESMLESDYVYRSILDRQNTWLSISPRLFFNVLLRRSLPERRDAVDRQVVHYVANLLGLFTRTERLYRVHPDDPQSYEYLVDLVQEADRADARRRFLVHSHIGNYALFLSGVCSAWVEHRQRYKRRPLGLEYYTRMGRSYYSTAARHRAADEYGLRPVLHRLAQRFDDYRSALQRLSRDYLPQAA